MNDANFAFFVIYVYEKAFIEVRLFFSALYYFIVSHNKFSIIIF